MDKLPRGFWRACVVLTHLFLVVVANELAFQLRFDGNVTRAASSAQLQMLPWLLVIRGLLFLPFRVHHGLWRYVGIWDLRNILASVTVSSVAFYVLTRFVFGISAYPRSVFVLDALLLMFLCGGLRLATRIWLEHSALRVARQNGQNGQKGQRKVLIFGAGKAGELIVRDIRNNAFYHYSPVGFVDDDHSKVGQTIHGLPVLGTRADLGKIIAEQSPR